MTWIAALTTVALMVLLVLLPSASRPTVPLGVSIPSSRCGETVVVAAVRRFRGGVSVVGLAAIALVLVVSFNGYDEIAMSCVPLAQLAASAVVYVKAREAIIAAKAAGQWYDGENVRIIGNVSPPREGARPVGLWWGGAALVVCLGVMAYGASIYSGLPKRIATHFDGTGTPDSWGERSVMTVFGPMMIAVALAIFLTGCANVVLRKPPRVYPDGDREAAIARAQAGARNGGTVLGALGLMTSLALGAISIMTWNGLAGAPIVAVLATVVVLPLLCGIVMLVRMMRVSTPPTAPATSAASVAPGRWSQTPDDDRYWKGGLIYYNPDDPATFVPKRLGVGVTVNAGSRGGKIFFAVILGILVLSVAGPLVAAALS